MDTFDVDELRAAFDPGDHEPIGAVQASDGTTALPLLGPILIRSN